MLHGRHGSEIRLSDSETCLMPLKHVGPMLALLGLLARPNSPNRGFNPFPPTHPYNSDITVVLKKVAENPAV